MGRNEFGAMFRFVLKLLFALRKLEIFELRISFAIYKVTWSKLSVSSLMCLGLDYADSDGKF